MSQSKKGNQSSHKYGCNHHQELRPCNRPFNEEINNEMITDEEIIASFKPIEEEVDIESKMTIPKVSIKDAVNALETAYNFFQQDDIEIDYIESKSSKSLKRKMTLLNIQKQKQANIETYFK